jgi:formylglycine-generating enzyme required for sulfatase activity
VTNLSNDLDDNYYNQNELTGGALDGRYYTEEELEPDSGDAAIVTVLNTLISRVDQLESDLEEAQGTISDHEETIADLEDPDCPLGYDRDLTGDNANYVVCKRGADEVVKVGDFWIDRYVDDAMYNGGACDGSGTVYGISNGDAHSAGFVRNGSDITTQLYACSLPNENPSRWITWFQAQEACGAAGKELCTNAQWQLAAFGTADPSATDPGDDSERCNIWENSKPADSLWGTTNETILTGSASQCISRYGAYDMVGNLWEWTANWYGQGADGDDGNQADDGEFHGDGYMNVDSAQFKGTYNPSNPVFSASAARGGNWAIGSKSGVFSFSLHVGVTYWDISLGARCCLK